ncbi:MAG TPA: hypothetical protein VGQ21_09970 [Thermoanaerobaculia bacterium]|jgi:hypothetical protein|nr:hypothetical protein [Thermoanaerobaculia bacterium]
MRSTIFTALLGLLASVPLSAECPCVPITHLWIVKTCNDWNCASTELAVASGDPQVIALPVALDDARWLIVRRFAAGAAIDSRDDPFQLQQFAGMDGAMPHYAGLTRDRRPMLMTAPDGQVLVISLKQPEVRRRPVAH